MKITKEVIEKLNPCKDRYDNYIKFYGNKELTKAQFLGRKNLTHKDKLWVAFRLMTDKQNRLVAADIAESVLHIFESQYPNDNRPRLAIIVARALARGEITAAAAYSAATSAYSAAAAYFASASATAAYSASASATAATAAAYSAAAYSAAYSASALFVTDSMKLGLFAQLKQEKEIRKIILKHWK